MLKLYITPSGGGTAEVMQFVPTVSWSGDYKQCARTLEFGILSSATDSNVPSISCPLGSSVIFSDDDNVLFDGYIFERQKVTGDSVIDITAYDRGIYVKRNEAVYKFSNMTPEAITSRVCADFGIETWSIAGTGVNITRNFIGVSLHKIIQTAYTLAAETTGEAYQIVFEGKRLSVIKKGAAGAVITIAGGSNLMSASTTESIKDMVNQVVIYDENDNLIDTQSNAELINMFGLLQSYLKKSKDDDPTAKARKILEDNDVSQKITVENLGDIRCTTGASVIVQEPYTGLKGLFYIDSDTHTWKNGLYLNKLVLNFKKIMDEQKAGTDKT